MHHFGELARGESGRWLEGVSFGRAVWGAGQVRFSSNSQEKVSAITTAVSSHPGKVLPMPLHDDLGSDRNGLLDPNAGTGEGSVLQSCGFVVGSSGGVFPGDLGRRPQDRPRFDVAAVHAIFIGVSEVEFSYPRGEGLRRGETKVAGEQKGNVSQNRSTELCK